MRSISVMRRRRRLLPMGRPILLLSFILLYVSWNQTTVLGDEMVQIATESDPDAEWEEYCAGMRRQQEAAAAGKLTPQDKIKEEVMWTIPKIKDDSDDNEEEEEPYNPDLECRIPKYEQEAMAAGTANAANRPQQTSRVAMEEGEGLDKEYLIAKETSDDDEYEANWRSGRDRMPEVNTVGYDDDDDDDDDDMGGCVPPQKIEMKHANTNGQPPLQKTQEQEDVEKKQQQWEYDIPDNHPYGIPQQQHQQQRLQKESATQYEVPDDHPYLTLHQNVAGRSNSNRNQHQQQSQKNNPYAIPNQHVDEVPLDSNVDPDFFYNDKEVYPMPVEEEEDDPDPDWDVPVAEHNPVVQVYEIPGSPSPIVVIDGFLGEAFMQKIFDDVLTPPEDWKLAYSYHKHEYNHRGLSEEKKRSTSDSEHDPDALASSKDYPKLFSTQLRAASNEEFPGFTRFLPPIYSQAMQSRLKSIPGLAELFDREKFRFVWDHKSFFGNVCYHPDSLSPPQSLPKLHKGDVTLNYHNTDLYKLAMIHYVSPVWKNTTTESGGTAFYADKYANYSRFGRQDCTLLTERAGKEHGFGSIAFYHASGCHCPRIAKHALCKQAVHEQQKRAFGTGYPAAETDDYRVVHHVPYQWDRVVLYDPNILNAARLEESDIEQLSCHASEGRLTAHIYMV